MRVLTVTNMYPTESNPHYGVFVRDQVESIRALGVEVDVLFVNALEGCLRHKAYPLGFPRLWNALRRRDYDLIHAHYVFSALTARAQWGLPVVLTHHGIELRHPWQGPLCRWTRGFADELIVVAPWMVKELGAPRAHVIPCGVDLTRFRPLPQVEARRALGLRNDRRYVLFAGQYWDRQKRLSLVEAAVGELRTRHPDIELLVVGRQPHDRIPLYMNAADAFTMVSITEGSAQVVKEAMACGLPVISTDAGDSWDVIGETPGCYRVGADPQEIAAALERALTPPRRAKGRLRVTRFSLDQVARQVVEVYEQACLHARRRRIPFSLRENDRGGAPSYGNKWLRYPKPPREP